MPLLKDTQAEGISKYGNDKKETPSVSFVGAPFKKQILSFPFWSMVVFLALQNLHIVYYLGTLNTAFHDNGQAIYVAVFNWIWICGSLSIPIFGWLLDHKGFAISLFAANIMCLLAGAISIIPVLPLQYATFVLISIVNPGLWSIYYSFLAVTYGFNNYGKLLGVASSLIAAVGALQFSLLWLTLTKLGGNFMFVNIFFTSLSLLLFLSPYYLYKSKL